MKVAEIIAAENSKTRENNLVRFYKEGVWYRAYELSAFLAHYFPNGLTDEQRLTPIHRNNKEFGSVISVGLKLDMLNKFMPGTFPVVNENFVDVYIDISLYEEKFVKDMENTFKEWKASVPMKDKIEQRNTIPQYLSKPMTFSAIMKAIITYQLESNSPNDAYKFIRELKDMVAQLI